MVMKNAYHQFLISDATKELSKVTTPFSTYRFNGLVQGDSLSSGYCQGRRAEDQFELFLNIIAFFFQCRKVLL